jgi:putative hydrolase of the HAD superfamily
LALRAVVFDYGMVLTGPPDPVSLEAILRITGLDPQRLDALYWKDRHAYDEGKLTGLAFWQQLARDAGLNLTAPQLDELNDWDARMWTTENPPMLAWQRELKARGFKTAILSNMGDNVHASIERQFPWLAGFDVLVWSYQLRIAKPDPAIYRHVLAALQVEARETFFIDDKQANIEAAQALGMTAHLFTTPKRLREDLITKGLTGELDRELPLPG